MQAARDIGAFLRRLFWYVVIGGLPFVFDLTDIYERRIKGGPLDPAFLPEPWVGWVRWLAVQVNEYLFVVLLVIGSFMAFREARRDGRVAEEKRKKAEADVERLHDDLSALRRLYDELVARGLVAMWDQREPATATERPEEPPTIAGPVGIEGEFSSTTPQTRRPRRRPDHEPPDQTRLPGF